MPNTIKECSLYTFTVNGTRTKTTPKDITARAAAEAAQTTANGKQDALTAKQLAAVNSGVTAEKVSTYDAFMESDPTVPTWAKQATKPTYTASEVGALPDDTVIPEASSAAPEMDGTAAAGSSDDYARADHVHPSDSSKQDALDSAQMDAVNSGITAAKVAGYDALQTIFGLPETLLSGADLNTYTNVGHYTANTNNTAKNISNCPVTVNFSLFVIYRTGAYVSQILIPSQGALFIRHQASSGWGSWYKFTGTTV